MLHFVYLNYIYKRGPGSVGGLPRLGMCKSHLTVSELWRHYFYYHIPLKRICFSDSEDYYSIYNLSYGAIFSVLDV